MGWATPTVSIKQTKTLKLHHQIIHSKKNRFVIGLQSLTTGHLFQSCHSNLEVFNQVKINLLPNNQKDRNKTKMLASPPTFNWTKNKQTKTLFIWSGHEFFDGNWQNNLHSRKTHNFEPKKQYKQTLIIILTTFEKPANKKYKTKCTQNMPLIKPLKHIMVLRSCHHHWPAASCSNTQ